MASAVGCGGVAAKLRLAKRPLTPTLSPTLTPHAGRGSHPRPAFAELFAALSEAFVAPTRRPPFILRPRAEPLAPLICTEALAAALVALAEAFAAFSESLVAPG